MGQLSHKIPIPTMFAINLEPLTPIFFRSIYFMTILWNFIRFFNIYVGCFDHQEKI